MNNEQTNAASLRPCPICKGDETRLLFAVRDTDRRTDLQFALHGCRVCGGGFVWPRPAADILAQLYDDEFFSKQSRRGLLASCFGRFEDALFRRRVGFIDRHVHPRCRRVLDVGCGNGKFLRAMRDGGREVLGIEPSPAGAVRAREDHGLEVMGLPVLEVDLGPSRFDLITFWHVLEHIDDPAAYLRHVARWLAPGGRILIAVPNFAGIEARWFKRRWAFLDIPRHLYQFTRRGLSQIATQASMRVVRDDLRLAEYSFPITVLNFCSVLSGDDPLLVYHLVKRQRQYAARRRKQIQALLILGCAAALSPALLLINFVTELCHSANGLIVVLERQEDSHATD